MQSKNTLRLQSSSQTTTTSNGLKGTKTVFLPMPAYDSTPMTWDVFTEETQLAVDQQSYNQYFQFVADAHKLVKTTTTAFAAALVVCAVAFVGSTLLWCCKYRGQRDYRDEGSALRKDPLP